MASSSALVVPIFIWHAPPSHAVTTSYLSLEHGRFITASDKGHIVLWKFSLKVRIFVACLQHLGMFFMIIPSRHALRERISLLCSRLIPQGLCNSLTRFSFVFFCDWR